MAVVEPEVEAGSVVPAGSPAETGLGVEVGFEPVVGVGVEPVVVVVAELVSVVAVAGE